MIIEIPIIDLLRICEALVEFGYECTRTNGRGAVMCSCCYAQELDTVVVSKMQHADDCPVSVAEQYIARCKDGE